MGGPQADYNQHTRQTSPSTIATMSSPPDMDIDAEIPPETTRQKEEDMAQKVSKPQGESSDHSTLEAKLSDEIRLRRFTEGVLDSRQQELEKQESENARLTKKLEALQKELAETQIQLTEARNQSKTKERHVAVCPQQVVSDGCKHGWMRNGRPSSALSLVHRRES